MRDTKASLRSTIREKLTLLPATQRNLLSSNARAILEKQPLWHNAQTILFFAPLSDELDIWPSMAVASSADKKVFLPRFHTDTKSYTACEVKSAETDLKIGQF